MKSLSKPINVTLEIQLTIAPELLTQLIPDLDSPIRTGILKLIADLAKEYDTKITVHHALVREKMP